MASQRVVFKLRAKSEENFTGHKGPYKFERGFFVSVVDAGKIEKLTRVMGTFYGATPWTPEEREDGDSKVPAPPANGGPGAQAPVQRDVRAVEPGPGKSAPAPGDGAAGAATGGPGSVPSGDGHADTGDDGSAERALRVREAVASLDPANDEHWTAGGAPRVDAVEKALGRAGLTRAEIEAAAPGYTRDTAK